MARDPRTPHPSKEEVWMSYHPSSLLAPPPPTGFPATALLNPISDGLNCIIQFRSSITPFRCWDRVLQFCSPWHVLFTIRVCNMCICVCAARSEMRGWGSQFHAPWPCDRNPNSGFRAGANFSNLRNQFTGCAVMGTGILSSPALVLSAGLNPARGFSLPRTWPVATL
jgi:hypothetical protein